MPLQFAADLTLSFIDEILPEGCLSILEVGCGNGLVAAGLSSMNHDVVAIDPSESAIADAWDRGVNAIHTTLETFEHAPFDVIFFGRSLHHIHHLDDALDRARSLLVPGGLIVLEEFGVERPDEPTARWFYDRIDDHTDGELVLREDHDPGPGVEPLERWRMEHLHDPPLHTSERMHSAIDVRFDISLFQSGPYMFRTFCNRLAAVPDGRETVQLIRDTEIQAIRSNAVVPVGMQIVASRRSKS